MGLDEVFAEKDKIANKVSEALSVTMEKFGFEIVRALVTDIDPAPEVKMAMNRIQAAERNKKAAEHEGEANKILIVAKAKAEAESKELQGKGISKMRLEIAEGLKQSSETLQKAGILADQANVMLMLTQYFDTAQALGDGNTKVIYMPFSPTQGNTFMSEMMASLEMTKNTDAV